MNTNCFRKIRKYVNVYGGSIAVTAFPLLAMEYLSLSLKGSHLDANFFQEVTPILTLVHVPMGYAIGKLCVEDIEKVEGLESRL